MFVFIAEILGPTFWCSNWRSVFDVVKSSPLNQFRKRVVEAYCSNKYTVIQGIDKKLYFVRNLLIIRPHLYPKLRFQISKIGSIWPSFRNRQLPNWFLALCIRNKLILDSKLSIQSKSEYVHILYFWHFLPRSSGSLKVQISKQSTHCMKIFWEGIDHI